MVSTSLKGATTVHHGHTPRIEVDGDTATGRWHMADYVTIPLPEGEAYVIRGYGYYDETYRRTPEGWRISSSADDTHPGRQRGRRLRGGGAPRRERPRDHEPTWSSSAAGRPGSPVPSSPPSAAPG